MKWVYFSFLIVMVAAFIRQYDLISIRRIHIIRFRRDANRIRLMIDKCESYLDSKRIQDEIDHFRTEWDRDKKISQDMLVSEHDALILHLNKTINNHFERLIGSRPYYE